MTSILPSTFRSQKSNIAAQDLIKLQNSTFKNGILRKKRQKLNFGKWPHRFVVLTHDSIYVYSNETSKIPNSHFSLLGYNRVSRCDMKGQEFCFSIIPASSMGSVKVKTFACFSDVDRKSWMQSVRSQIFTANNIPKPVLTVIDRIKLMTTGDMDEDLYLALEQAVYETNDEASIDKDSDNDDDSDCSSDEEIDSSVCKKASRSLSLPHNSTITFDNKKSKKYSKNRKFSEPHSGEYETCKELLESMEASQQNIKRLPSDPQPGTPTEATTPHSNEVVRPLSDSVQSLPPRYSEVYRADVEEHLENDYVNLSTLQRYKNDSQQESLEAMCTISGTCDRNLCIALLKEKKEHGTYLIRDSRTGNQKVISFLEQDGKVKEYKIHGTADKLTLDNQKFFTCIEEILQHYTSEEHLPCINDFLKKGFHQIDTVNEK